MGFSKAKAALPTTKMNRTPKYPVLAELFVTNEVLDDCLGNVPGVVSPAA